MRTPARLVGRPGRDRLGIIGRVSSQLSAVPPRQRRRAAAVAGFFAIFLIVAGALPWIGTAEASVRILGTVAIVAGVVLGLICWGMVYSLRVDAVLAVD